MLRSWVQFPPGPLFNVVQLRHWFEFIFDECRTKSLALRWINSIKKVFDDIFDIPRLTLEGWWQQKPFYRSHKPLFLRRMIESHPHTIYHYTLLISKHSESMDTEGRVVISTFNAAK